MNLLENNKKKLIPIRLPQYEIINDNLVFMNFRNKHFNKSLVEAFGSINNVDNWDTLVSKGVREIALETLIDKKCIILVETNPTKKDTPIEKILILAPHVDDTAFALGGYIAKNKLEKDFYIINVFGKQNYTLYWDYYEKSRVKFYQKEEEKVFWRTANIRNAEIWDYPDAPLRETYLKHAYINSEDSTNWIIEQELELLMKLTDRLAKKIEELKPDKLLCPIGIGRHVDHILVRQMCFNLELPMDKIVFYEDMPYSISFKHVSELEEINNVYHGTLKMHAIDISKFLEDKKKFISIYQSQLKSFQMKAILKYSMNDCMEKQYVIERLWSFYG